VGCEAIVRSALEVSGFGTAEYLTALYDAVFNTDVEGDTLEVGCFMGQSTTVIASALRDRKMDETLTVIDGFMAPEEDEALGKMLAAIYKPAGRFRAGMERAELSNYTLIEKDSQQFETWDEAPSKIRFAHVDGDHSYEGCRFDLERVLERATNGAVIAMDDYQLRNWEWGVHRAVGEVLLPRARRQWTTKGGEQIFVEVEA